MDIDLSEFEICGDDSELNRLEEERKEEERIASVLLQADEEQAKLAEEVTQVEEHLRGAQADQSAAENEAKRLLEAANLAEEERQRKEEMRLHAPAIVPTELGDLLPQASMHAFRQAPTDQQETEVGVVDEHALLHQPTMEDWQTVEREEEVDEEGNIITRLNPIPATTTSPHGYVPPPAEVRQNPYTNISVFQLDPLQPAPSDDTPPAESIQDFAVEAIEASDESAQLRHIESEKRKKQQQELGLTEIETTNGLDFLSDKSQKNSNAPPVLEGETGHYDFQLPRADESVEMKHEIPRAAEAVNGVVSSGNAFFGPRTMFGKSGSNASSLSPPRSGAPETGGAFEEEEPHNAINAYIHEGNEVPSVLRFPSLRHSSGDPQRRDPSPTFSTRSNEEPTGDDEKSVGNSGGGGRGTPSSSALPFFQVDSSGNVSPALGASQDTASPTPDYPPLPAAFNTSNPSPGATAREASPASSLTRRRKGGSAVDTVVETADRRHLEEENQRLKNRVQNLEGDMLRLKEAMNLLQPQAYMSPSRSGRNSQSRSGAAASGPIEHNSPSPIRPQVNNGKEGAKEGSIPVCLDFSRSTEQYLQSVVGMAPPESAIVGDIAKEGEVDPTQQQASSLSLLHSFGGNTGSLDGMSGGVVRRQTRLGRRAHYERELLVFYLSFDKKFGGYHQGSSGKINGHQSSFVSPSSPPSLSRGTYSGVNYSSTPMPGGANPAGLHSSCSLCYQLKSQQAIFQGNLQTELNVLKNSGYAICSSFVKNQIGKISQILDSFHGHEEDLFIALRGKYHMEDYPFTHWVEPVSTTE